MSLSSSIRKSVSQRPGGSPFFAASVAILLASSAGAEIPHGVFCLLPAGRACPASALNNSDVMGLGIRQTWADLEPTEGHYDWTFLDTEVGRAAAAGKVVLLRILTQIGKPAWVTTAVTDAGGSFFHFEKEGVPTTIPVFWDPTFLAKKKAMIAALGAHFGNNPTVKVVAVNFANANSEDWSVPHTQPDIEQWGTLGYSSQKLIDAGKAILDAAMTAFPTQYITLAVAGNGGLDPDVSYVARNAIASARASWPGRLIVQKNSLAAKTPPAPGTGTVYGVIWESQPDVAGQMLAAAADDPTFRDNDGVPDSAANILHRTTDIAVGYGMKYMEIYQKDVTGLPAEITYARAALLGASSSAPPPGATPPAPTGLRRAP